MKAKGFISLKYDSLFAFTKLTMFEVQYFLKSSREYNISAADLVGKVSAGTDGTLRWLSNEGGMSSLRSLPGRGAIDPHA